ncbi:MAG TPA: hypothetical protein VG694_02375 [Candidatus Paceibacterota bacterium]|jgi:hypothetical protein|nr:hypothetical protein [Candidatus Paceibacterota bacterium]
MNPITTIYFVLIVWPYYMLKALLTRVKKFMGEEDTKWDTVYIIFFILIILLILFWLLGWR